MSAACARATAPSRCCAASISPSAPARSWRCWAATAPASRRSTTMSAASTGRSAAPSLRRPGDIAGAPSMRIVEAGLVQVPEGRRVFPNLSVRENLELGSYRRGRAARAQNLERVLAIFPRLNGAAGAARRHAVGRRAADAGDRPRPDERAATADPRRAVARPVAAAGRGDVRADRPAQRAMASRSCWSSRTSCSRSPSPIAPMSWKTAASPSQARRPSSPSIRNCARATSGISSPPTRGGAASGAEGS